MSQKSNNINTAGLVSDCIPDITITPDIIKVPEYETADCFTCHEHLDAFGLINMNGRMYDPYVGRFLSVDPVIQFPGNALSYNGYGYCLNNPLKYSDPSGMVMKAYDEGDAAFDAYFSWACDRNMNFSYMGDIGGGGGGNPCDQSSTNTCEDPFDAMNSLWNSKYGGYWSPSTGKVYYKNDIDAIACGIYFKYGDDYLVEWGYEAGPEGSHVITFVLKNGSRITIKQNSNSSEIVTSPSEQGSTPWMDVAKGEMGVKEIYGSQNNPRIIEYHSTTGGFKDDETPWCSSFANWTMKQSGIKGTGSALAKSWLNWGNQLDGYRYGAITVVQHGNSYHVGFAVNANSSYVRLLGGNQGPIGQGQVKYSNFPLTIYKVTYVYPVGY